MAVVITSPPTPAQPRAGAEAYSTGKKFGTGLNALLYMSPRSFPGFDAWWTSKGREAGSYKKRKDARRIWSAARRQDRELAMRRLGLVGAQSAFRLNDPSIATGQDTQRSVPIFQTPDPAALQRPVYWWFEGRWWPAAPEVVAEGKAIARDTHIQQDTYQRKRTVKLVLGRLAMGAAFGGAIIAGIRAAIGGRRG